MRSRMLVAVVVSTLALVLVGCGSDDDESPRTRPTPSASRSAEGQPGVTLAQARAQWDDAVKALVLDGGGRFHWTARVKGLSRPLWDETGVFGFDPMRMATTRVASNPSADSSEPSSYTLRMVRRGGRSFMQGVNWGPWDGCWLEVSAEDVEEHVDEDLAKAFAGSPALPASVAVALDATVSGTTADHFTGPYTEYTATASAVAVLQFLGLGSSYVVPAQEHLRRIKVPMTVAIGTDDRPYGAAADGRAVLTALGDRSGLGDEVLESIPLMSAEVVLTDAGDRAAVRLPGQRYVLPPGATRKDTCPANR